MMERTAHRGMAGVTLGNEVFTDLDFVDDVALLAEMLEVLVLAMTIMQEEVAVLLYGCETWSTTKLQCSRIDAFDMWALHKILRIPYTRHVTNVEVRATTGCRPLSHLVTDRRLRLFGHIARRVGSITFKMYFNYKIQITFF